jgi:integrase
MEKQTRRVPGLYRRGRVWWCKYYINGRPVYESTGTDKEQEAKRLLAIRKGAVATGAPLPPRLDRIRYDELAQDLRRFYTTTGNRELGEAEDRLAHLDRFFSGRRAIAIGSSLIREYVEKRQGETTHLVAERREDGTVVRRPTSNRTINLELALLKRMLRLAAHAEPPKLLRVPRIEMLKEAPPREGFFEDHQSDGVRRRLPEDVQAALAVAHTYGWRMTSEVFALERRHLDLAAGTLRLDPGMTKNSEGRMVYLTPALTALLAAQVERVERLSKQIDRIIPWLFPHRTGRLAGMQRKGMRKRWRTAVGAAGVPGRIPHDFRRTAVRNLERRGVARSVAMKITGHKTESVYRRYAIVSDAELREAALKLAAGDAAQGYTGGDSQPIPLETRSVTRQNP